MERIRLLIADDHAILRAGLRMLLEAQPDMEVMGEAAEGEEAVQKALQLEPDVILLDITMPGASGLEVLQRIVQARPKVKVLILTMHDDQGYLRRALQAGASGYVLKRAADTELLSAVRAVGQGGIFLHQDHARILVEPSSAEARARTERARYDGLSGREQEVLHLVALGHTNRQIAEKLYLSVKTVETYKARAMSKLGLQGRAALVRYALERGLLTPETD